MTAELQNQMPLIGSEGIYLQEVDSTNDHLKTLVESRDLPHGYFVASEYQTSGRGQVGKRWLADAGQNLLLSALYRPVKLGIDRYFYLNMSVCLALMDTLNQFHKGFVIKWPNDILFDKKKIAGILIENSIANGHLRQAIVGIGVNVNQRNFPPVLEVPPVSLSGIMGRSVDRSYLRESLFQRLNARYRQFLNQPESIRQQFQEHLYGFHEAVPVKVGHRKGPLQIRAISGDGTMQAHWQGQKTSFQFRELRFLL